jgi:hypothetical protein
MTFPLAPNRISAKLRLLLLVSAFFTHAAISEQSRTISFTIDTPNVNQRETIYTEHMFMTAGRILVSATSTSLSRSPRSIDHPGSLETLILAALSLLAALTLAALSCGCHHNHRRNHHRHNQ